MRKRKLCTKCRKHYCASYHHCWCKQCINTYNRKRFAENPELRRRENLRATEWQKKNREKANRNSARWRKKHPDKVKMVKEKYRGRNPERVKERQAFYRRQRRLRVLTYYSKSKIPVCECCGEKILEFLCLDHKYGGGNEHRRKMGVPSGTNTYQWVIKNNFPDKFRVLCYNCNNAYGHYGYCPHKKT